MCVGVSVSCVCVCMCVCVCVCVLDPLFYNKKKGPANVECKS